MTSPLGQAWVPKVRRAVERTVRVTSGPTVPSRPWEAHPHQSDCCTGPQGSCTTKMPWTTFSSFQGQSILPWGLLGPTNFPLPTPRSLFKGLWNLGSSEHGDQLVEGRVFKSGWSGLILLEAGPSSRDPED